MPRRWFSGQKRMYTCSAFTSSSSAAAYAKSGMDDSGVSSREC